MDDNAAPMAEPREPTPFDRFTDLTRKIVSVPKRDVDEIRKERQKSRGTPTTK